MIGFQGKVLTETALPRFVKRRTLATANLQLNTQ